ncbi:MAG: F0F1 ATP synthase subunit A [Candidatus Limnocylindrus sp.]|jgi:F-type H+-transporting ATPase subunit a|nr:F0F1 ATP synthase subunit A [Candidatus Aquidulcis sp.]
MSVAPAKKSSTKRTLLLAALGVLALDAFAIAVAGGVGLKDFPGGVIAKALEPIVPHTVINLGGEEHHAATLFDFYPSITGSMIMSWIVMAVVIIPLTIAARRLKEIPSGVQNVLEFAIEGLTSFAMGIGGPGAKRFITFFLACFLFIAVSNWSGLIPGVGRVHEFRAPTSDVNVTVGLALVAFVYFHYQGVRALGVGGYLGKFFTLKGGIVGLFVGVLEFFLELVKPVTLAMRLFGNIYGGELALTVMTTITLAFIPVALYGLELFVGLMQGIIFSVLVLVFTMLAMEGHHEEGHDEHSPAAAGDGATAGAESRVAAH